MLTKIVDAGKHSVNEIYFYDGVKYYIVEIETQGNLSRLWLKPFQK